MFEKIFTFLDYKSVASLELTCTLLRDVVIQNKVYKKMFRQVVEETFAEPYCGEELLQEMSCFYKNKLFQHFHRYALHIDFRLFLNFIIVKCKLMEITLVTRSISLVNS